MISLFYQDNVYAFSGSVSNKSTSFSYTLQDYNEVYKESFSASSEFSIPIGAVDSVATFSSVALYPAADYYGEMTFDCVLFDITANSPVVSNSFRYYNRSGPNTDTKTVTVDLSPGHTYRINSFDIVLSGTKYSHGYVLSVTNTVSYSYDIPPDPNFFVKGDSLYRFFELTDINLPSGSNHAIISFSDSSLIDDFNFSVYGNILPSNSGFYFDNCEVIYSDQTFTFEFDYYSSVDISSIIFYPYDYFDLSSISLGGVFVEYDYSIYQSNSDRIINDLEFAFGSNDSTNSAIDSMGSEFEQYQQDTDTSTQYSNIGDDLFTLDTSMFSQLAPTITLFASCVTSTWSALGDFSVALTVFLIVVLMSCILGLVRYVSSSGTSDRVSESMTETTSYKTGPNTHVTHTRTVSHSEKIRGRK